MCLNRIVQRLPIVSIYYYVHNPTIVVFSIISRNSFSKTILSFFVPGLSHVALNTFLQQGYFLVGLLDAQARKSHNYVRRNSLNTKIPQSQSHTNTKSKWHDAGRRPSPASAAAHGSSASVPARFMVLSSNTNITKTTKCLYHSYVGPSRIPS